MPKTKKERWAKTELLLATPRRSADLRALPLKKRTPFASGFIDWQPHQSRYCADRSVTLSDVPLDVLVSDLPEAICPSRGDQDAARSRRVGLKEFRIHSGKRENKKKKREKGFWLSLVGGFARAGREGLTE
jgi:hypothetical protein